MKNVLAEITRLRLERGWNEYELAKHCGLSQSTISTWYRKNQTPTIQTLDKVCKGLGISLSQFFAEGSDAVLIIGGVFFCRFTKSVAATGLLGSLYRIDKYHKGE